MAIFGLIRCCRDPGWSGINATARFLSGHHGPKNWNSWPPHIWWIIFLWQCDDANVHRMQTASTMFLSSSLVPYPSLKVYWGSSIRRFVNKQFTWNWHRDGRIFVFLLATAWWCWSGIQETGIGYSDISGLETAWCYLEYQAKCNIQVASEIGTCWRDWLATYQDWEVWEDWAAWRWHCNNDDGVVITFKRIIFPTWSSTSWLLCLSFSHIVSFRSGLAHHDHYHLIPQLPPAVLWFYR